MESFSGKDINSIFDSVHDGMIAVNKEGVVTLFNKVAERIIGLKRDSVLMRPVVDVIPNSRLHFVLLSGEPELNQQQNLGNTIVITSRVPIRNEAGEIIGAVAVFKDITEINALTTQVSDLWKAHNLLEAIIEATEDAISVADENGNRILVNAAYTKITGHAKESVLNRPVTINIAEGESMHLKVLRTGKSMRNVRMRVGPANKDVIVNIAPIFIESRIKGSVEVIHDISEVVTLSEELTQAKKLIRHLEARYTWEDIIGRSDVIERSKDQARMAAETSSTVLLKGESGSGKELFAHAIHNASDRRKGQFVRVNCAAISESLLESELFGYEEGAFTGALKGGRKGLFEEADGGTIFLDEIGDISLSVQSKLLRVLQEREIIRVGGARTILVDVRVIAATNQDLEQRVKRKAFREDLYYRLDVVPIYIPPLRDRKEDIPLIARHLAFKLNKELRRQVQEISEAADKSLMGYDWPGNVRELENILRRAMIYMRPQDTIMDIEHLPYFACEKISILPSLSGPIEPLDKILKEVERSVIERAIKEKKGNYSEAAKLLNMTARNLYYKMKKYKLREEID